MNSHYLFWNNSYMKQAESVLESIIEQQGLILQQTLFYPASGGQPYDQGIIKIGNYSLKVESVKKFEGGKTLIIPEYIIDIKNKSKKTLELVEHFENLKGIDLQSGGNIIELKDKKKFKKKPFRKKKFFKKVK